MIRIGITHGDINGTGYELILKAFAAEELLSLCTPVIYGSPKAAIFHRKTLENQTNFIVRNNINEVRDQSVNMINCFGEEELKIEFGHQSEANQDIAKRSLDCALADLHAGSIDALVALPCTIEGCHSQFGYISQQYNNTTVLPLLVSDNLCVASATNFIPVAGIPRKITTQLLTDRLTSLRSTLQRDFSIESPRIAVLSLNPIDSAGVFAGSEEADVIQPLVQQLFDKGSLCFGPYTSDRIFGQREFEHFDAILAMYSDQASTSFHTLTQGEGYRFLSGLPHVITSPIHDAQFEIAGKDMASPQSFLNALYSAIDRVRRRRQFDSARANPLQKQFYDRRDDSDKLRLDQVQNDDEPEVSLV